MGRPGGGHPGWGLHVGECSGVWRESTLGQSESLLELRGAATCAVRLASSRLGFSTLIVSSFLTTNTWLIVVVVVMVDLLEVELDSLELTDEWFPEELFLEVEFN